MVNYGMDQAIFDFMEEEMRRYTSSPAIMLDYMKRELQSYNDNFTFVNEIRAQKFDMLIDCMTLLDGGHVPSLLDIPLHIKFVGSIPDSNMMQFFGYGPQHSSVSSIQRTVLFGIAEADCYYDLQGSFIHRLQNTLGSLLLRGVITDYFNLLLSLKMSKWSGLYMIQNKKKKSLKLMFLIGAFKVFLIIIAQFLKHPKVKIFLSHGGANSFSESIQANVPLIISPLFAPDQVYFCEYAKIQKVGLCPKQTTVYEINKAIETLEKNNYFSSQLQYFQRIVEQKKQDPHDFGYWLDYSLTIGTRHLQAEQIHNFNMIQLYDFDVRLVIGLELQMSWIIYRGILI
eukprot:403354426